MDYFKDFETQPPSCSTTRYFWRNKDSFLAKSQNTPLTQDKTTPPNAPSLTHKQYATNTAQKIMNLIQKEKKQQDLSINDLLDIWGYQNVSQINLEDLLKRRRKILLFLHPDKQTDPQSFFYQKIEQSQQCMQFLEKTFALIQCFIHVESYLNEQKEILLKWERKKGDYLQKKLFSFNSIPFKGKPIHALNEYKKSPFRRHFLKKWSLNLLSLPLIQDVIFNEYDVAERVIEQNTNAARVYVLIKLTPHVFARETDFKKMSAMIITFIRMISPSYGNNFYIDTNLPKELTINFPIIKTDLNLTALHLDDIFIFFKALSQYCKQTPYYLQDTPYQPNLFLTDSTSKEKKTQKNKSLFSFKSEKTISSPLSTQIMHHLTIRHSFLLSSFCNSEAPIELFPYHLKIGPYLPSYTDPSHLEDAQWTIGIYFQGTHNFLPDHRHFLGYLQIKDEQAYFVEQDFWINADIYKFENTPLTLFISRAVYLEGFLSQQEDFFSKKIGIPIEVSVGFSEKIDIISQKKELILNFRVQPQPSSHNADNWCYYWSTSIQKERSYLLSLLDLESMCLKFPGDHSSFQPTLSTKKSSQTPPNPSPQPLLALPSPLTPIAPSQHSRIQSSKVNKFA